MFFHVSMACSMVFLFLNSPTCYLSVRIKCVGLLRRSISKSFNMFSHPDSAYVSRLVFKCTVVDYCFPVFELKYDLIIMQGKSVY